MEQGRRVAAAILTVLGVLLGGASTAVALDGSLVTPDPIQQGGYAETEGEGGIALTWAQGGSATLEAENATVRTEYEHGDIYAAQAGGVAYVEDRGVVYRNLTNATVTFSPWTDRGQVVGVPDVDVDVTGEAPRGSRIVGLPSGQLLGGAGVYGENVSTSDDGPPGVSFRTEHPLVAQEGLDRARSQGSFKVFVNNVTFEAAGEDTRYQNWSGYREYEGPPGVTEYRRHVTVISADEGELSLSSPGEVELLASQATTSVEGSVSIQQATGQLREGTVDVALASEPVSLRGSGTVALEPEPSDQASDEVGLDSRVQGSFTVVDGPGPSESEALGPASTAIGSGAWLWIGLASLLAAGAALGLRFPRLLSPLPSRLREPLYHRWRRIGAEREDGRAFTAAAQAFAKMHALFPGRPLGWYLEARAHLDAEHPRQALSVVEAAQAHLEAVPLDLFEIEVAAAARLDDDERARAALERLADRSTVVAEGLVADLSLDVETTFATDPDDGDAPGGARGYV